MADVRCITEVVDADTVHCAPGYARTAGVSLNSNHIGQREKPCIKTTGEAEKTLPPPEKNQAAVELGRLGGKKGGKARAKSLTPEQRSEIAKKAAQARWKNN